ncbi:MAG: uL15m family ribosomal protein [Candidatus Nanoarchaeia archaeon]|nr:uL15m family ribosomal protein [Candidatus Nanoarchaeia archaeon]
MVVSRKKKNKKFRGSKTHGWGSTLRHRGAGSRGGRGMAGSGKRADHKKISILKEYGHSYFGKHGFRRPQKMLKHLKAINIIDLPDKDKINLTEMGIDKLLSKGTPKRKYEIIVSACSEKAKEKIQSAGGKILAK